METLKGLLTEPVILEVLAIGVLALVAKVDPTNKVLDKVKIVYAYIGKFLNVLETKKKS